MNAFAAPGGRLRHVAALSRHRYSTWLLAAIAFTDSSVLPLPPDLLLVPMILIQPERTPMLLVVCILGSSLGAAAGYLIGYGLWSAVGDPLMQLYGHADSFAAYQRLVHDWGVWFIIGKGFTPIPFMVATIAAGVAAMPPIPFMMAVLVARGLHFAIFGTLLALYGGKVLALVARYERPFAVISLLLVVGLLVAYHLR